MNTSRLLNLAVIFSLDLESQFKVPTKNPFSILAVAGPRPPPGFPRNWPVAGMPLIAVFRTQTRN